MCGESRKHGAERGKTSTVTGNAVGKVYLSLSDGITSSTLLYKGLKKLNANVTVRLPIRSEGYGLSAKVMNELPSNISLIITVDNGSSAHEAMQVAKQKE